jgi:hypothetical protein
MKDGSFLRLPKEAASSRRDGSSWSEGKGEQEGEGEEGEAAAAFDGKGEAEANTLEDGGGEDGATALQEGELGICLVGRWAAEGFLQERRGSRSEGEQLLGQVGAERVLNTHLHGTCPNNKAPGLLTPTSTPGTTGHCNPGPSLALSPRTG